MSDGIIQTTSSVPFMTVCTPFYNGGVVNIRLNHRCLSASVISPPSLRDYYHISNNFLVDSVCSFIHSTKWSMDMYEAPCWVLSIHFETKLTYIIMVLAVMELLFLLKLKG